VTFGLTLFKQDLVDEINGFVFDPTTFLVTAENRIGNSDRSGVEFEASMELSETFDLTGSYTYIDSNQTNSGVTTRELRRPRHSGNVTATYRFLEGRGNVLLAADYGGTRTDIFFPPFPNPSQTVLLDNYWLVDLTAGYKLTDNLDAFVRVNNLLDENYEQVFGFATPGRAAYLGLRTNFGQ
jgi:vitamin B12 transporter